MPNIFITSDTHFGHANIIKLCKRPFASVEEMDETLIANWNAVIRPGDRVYHLGDFCHHTRNIAQKCTLLKRLNGYTSLILGNHDDPVSIKHTSIPWYGEPEMYRELSIDGKARAILFHYPIVEWNGWYRGNLHFHGHQHNTKALQAERRIDVGVDANNFKPWALEDLVALTR